MEGSHGEDDDRDVSQPVVVQDVVGEAEAQTLALRRVRERLMAEIGRQELVGEALRDGSQVLGASAKEVSVEG